jgi:hypothetical protein
MKLSDRVMIYRVFSLDEGSTADGTLGKLTDEHIDDFATFLLKDLAFLHHCDYLLEISEAYFRSMYDLHGHFILNSETLLQYVMSLPASSAEIENIGSHAVLFVAYVTGSEAYSIIASTYHLPSTRCGWVCLGLH